MTSSAARGSARSPGKSPRAPRSSTNKARYTESVDAAVNLSNEPGAGRARDHRLASGITRRRVHDAPPTRRSVARDAHQERRASVRRLASDRPLQWKGRWFSNLAGGVYDVRARQWSPGMGVFLEIDEFNFHKRNSTLWGWARQNPTRFSDPSGHDGVICPGDQGCSDPGDGGLPPGGAPVPTPTPTPCPCDPTTQSCPPGPLETCSRIAQGGCSGSPRGGYCTYDCPTNGQIKKWYSCGPVDANPDCPWSINYP
jgi:RHS repeat-associated protein